VIDAEWRPVEETALVRRPSHAERPHPVVVRPRPIPALATAAACPVCRKGRANVTAKLGIFNVRVCARCAQIGYAATFVLTRLLG
jgi:hypothetical protein